MRKTLRFTTALSAIAIIACAESIPTSPDGAPTAVRIRTASVQFVPGDRVPLTLENTGPVEATYGGCPSGLETLRTGRWIAAPGYTIESCDAFLILHRIAPGESKPAVANIPESLPRGVYRVLYRFQRPFGNTRMDEQFTDVSNAFEVR